MDRQISNECEQDRERLTPHAEVSCSPASTEARTDEGKDSLVYLLAVLGNSTSAGASRYFWETVGLFAMLVPVFVVVGFFSDQGTRTFLVGLTAFLIVCATAFWLYIWSINKQLLKRSRDLIEKIERHPGNESPVPRESLEALWFLSLRTSGEPPETRQRAAELYRRLKSQEARHLPIAAEPAPASVEQLPITADPPPG
jgi:hypothetical protein